MLTEVSDAPLYNTAAVVQRTAVPATTIRAWERRYGFPKPQRDPGGQRLYSERDIQAIRWLAEQTAQGVTISRAVNMLRTGHADTESAASAAARPTRSFEILRTELEQSLLRFDADRAEALMSEAFALYPLEDVCLQILEPLLVEVGERWHAGGVSVGDEHYVTAFVRARLYALLHVYQHSPERGALIFTACAPEEWHEVGILLVSIFLARRGFAVRYLGPNLPLEGLAAVVARHHPAVVVLSAQSDHTARKLRAGAGLLLAGPPPHTSLAFGGQAFNVHASLRKVVEGTYVGPDAATAVEGIARLVEQHAAPIPSRRGRSASQR